MTAAEPLNPERLAAILVEHERHWQSHGSTLCLGGREYADAEHCLPYRLAAEVERLQARIREQIFRERECAALTPDPLGPPVMVPCSVVADDLQRILDGGAS